MSQVSVAILQNSQVFDTNSSASSGVLRDGSGNVIVAQCLASELKTSGGLTIKSTSKTANFTADPTATVVYRCNATGGSFTASLPSAVGLDDRLLIFTKTDSSTNAVVITGAVVAASCTAQGSFRHTLSDGANWQVVG